MKYCMHCMTKIPILASRCPNCISDRQGTGGRIVFWLFVIGAIVFVANVASKRSTNSYVSPVVAESNKVNEPAGENKTEESVNKPEIKPSYVITNIDKKKDKEELKGLLKEVGYFKKGR